MNNPKPNARILDATAGNRSIWKIKESDKILWIDVEPALDYTPDIIIDCTKTTFPDNYFHHVFFDPPHGTGKKPGDMWSCRNKEERKSFEKRYPNSHGSFGNTYYGMDKYKTKTELLAFLYHAFDEIFRILDDSGL